MKMKKILTAGVLACISAGCLGACGVQQPDSPQKIHVGVTYYNQSDTFISELNTCFKEKLKKQEKGNAEIALTIRDAAGSQRTQNDQVKEMLDIGCNVLCVNLVDRADPSEIIDLAKTYGVPMVFFNREPVEEDLMQWDGLYYVGADAEESGVMQGELAVDVIKNNPQIDRNRDGKIQYVVLEGEAGHQDSIIRTENAVDTLKKNGVSLEKLSYQIANWNRAQAQNRMEQMIAQHQNKIELVLANNDAMALGAIDAYEKLNVTESALPVFFGIDGTDSGLEAIIDNRLSGTVYNDKEGQAEAMAELAVAAVTKEGMEDIPFEEGKYVRLPYYKVTNENAGELLREEKQ